MRRSEEQEEEKEDEEEEDDVEYRVQSPDRVHNLSSVACSGASCLQGGTQACHRGHHCTTIQGGRH